MGQIEIKKPSKAKKDKSSTVDKTKRGEQFKYKKTKNNK